MKKKVLKKNMKFYKTNAKNSQLLKGGSKIKKSGKNRIEIDFCVLTILTKKIKNVTNDFHLKINNLIDSEKIKFPVGIFNFYDKNDNLIRYIWYDDLNTHPLFSRFIKEDIKILKKYVKTDAEKMRKEIFKILDSWMIMGMCNFEKNKNNMEMVLGDVTLYFKEKIGFPETMLAKLI